MENKHRLRPGRADIHLLVGSWKLGEGGGGGWSICLCLTGALLWPPQKATLGQEAYTIVIGILSTSLTSVSMLSVCWCSRYVSLWWIPCPKGSVSRWWWEAGHQLPHSSVSMLSVCWCSRYVSLWWIYLAREVVCPGDGGRGVTSCLTAQGQFLTTAHAH